MAARCTVYVYIYIYIYIYIYLYMHHSRSSRHVHIQHSDPDVIRAGTDDAVSEIYPQLHVRKFLHARQTRPCEWSGNVVVASVHRVFPKKRDNSQSDLNPEISVRTSFLSTILLPVSRNVPNISSQQVLLGRLSNIVYELLQISDLTRSSLAPKDSRESGSESPIRCAHPGTSF